MWPWKNKTGAGAEALVHDERHLSSCSSAQDMVLDSQTLLFRCVCVGGPGGGSQGAHLSNTRDTGPLHGLKVLPARGMLMPAHREKALPLWSFLPPTLP